MPLAPGAFVGPYEVLAWLGAGAQGDVYRAYDSRLGREVAVKVLSVRHAEDPERQRRFEQEARAAGRLDHPGVLVVHDVGTHDGCAFIVSELLRGASLRDVLSGGALALDRAIDYARQVAQGLAAAHDLGLVHRDIKPENLFVTVDGRVKILDFGVVKLLQPDAEPPPGAGTETQDAVIGSPGYLSPEQARGASVDARSDLFSLGAVLHEMLSGAPAFQRSTPADTLVAVLHGAPSPPLPRTVPPSVAAVVARCVEKDRSARFQSARDLDFALLQSADAAPPGARVARPPVGRRLLLVGGGGVAVAAAVGLLSQRAPSPSIEARFSNATYTRLADWPSAEGQAAISPDGRFVAFLSDRDGQVDLWLTQIGAGRPRNMTEGRATLRPPGMVLRLVAFSADGLEIASEAAATKEAQGLTLTPVTGGAARPILSQGSLAPAWSVDGRLAYFSVAGGDAIFVADRNGADAHRIFGGGVPDVHTHNPVWAVDGRWIYFVHGPSVGQGFDMDIWRVRPDGTGAERLTTLKTAVHFLAPIDARTLLYVAPGPDRSGPWLWALDVPTRSSRRVASGVDQYRSVAASRDGRRLVATIARPASGLARVAITDRVAEERDIERVANPSGDAHAPRLGPRTLFYLARGDADQGLWRTQDGAASEIWPGSNGPVFDGPAVTRDGRRLAVVISLAGRSRLATMAADGTDVRTLVPALTPDGGPSWSPDARAIVVGGTMDGAPGLFIVPDDGGPVVRIVQGVATNPAWSPAGGLIVYNGPIVTGVSTLRAVRPDGTPVALPRVDVRPGGQRFTPDGAAIVYQSDTLDFHRLDLATGVSRQLTAFRFTTPLMSGRSFDLTPDGTAIVFDRTIANSDVVMIDLPDPGSRQR
ncbi:MAG: protein kinase [Vicinamibacterales bacterium]